MYHIISSDGRNNQVSEKRRTKWNSKKISVTNVQDNNGSTGFQAIVTITDTLTGTVREHAVKTNRNGEGFWIDGQQCAGTCQFSVRSREAWRAAVRRWFKN